MPATIDHRLMVHRLNLPQSAEGERSFLKELVGSKSGISILDSKTGDLCVPLSSSAEVDFWVFRDGPTILTHLNPSLKKLESYPTLETFIEAWQTKRALEERAGAPHGIILANLKTHGSEEWFIERCGELGVPAKEIVLLDQEYPATDRILREKRFGPIAPLAIRISRIEPLAGILSILESQETFSVPHAVFLDPIGFNTPTSRPLVLKTEIEQMYTLAPSIEFIVCCPSRWGDGAQIDALAANLKENGVRQPLIMTDVPLFKQWSHHLDNWTPRETSNVLSAA